ncbi:hypothetical protein AU15_12170 [Marinobacter salarius]|uniref:Uncharacterized protein n=1 Tax=Marinobacter salarius TaxID=1420917 RepID=W5YWG3_9GAMM|nr:hypothetical protein AU15_12170 [Marinobacter salarius]
MPWSEILHVICVEGGVDLAYDVKSPVTDSQGNEFFGFNYDFNGCLKPEGQLYQGKLGVYWDSESTIYVVEMEDFSISESSAETPPTSSGVFVLSVDEDTGFKSEFVTSVREDGSDEPAFESMPLFLIQMLGWKVFNGRGFSHWRGTAALNCCRKMGIPLGVSFLTERICCISILALWTATSLRRLLTWELMAHWMPSGQSI